MSDDSKPGQKTYHKRATGAALGTIKKHSKDHELKLFASCFWYAILIGDATSMILKTNPSLLFAAHMCSEYGFQWKSKASAINILK